MYYNGIEWGNRWYFSPTETMGFGLMINWLDATYSKKEISVSGIPTLTRAVLDLTFIEIGPLGTYALSDDMAVDGYYNLRPTWFTSVLSDNTESFGYSGFGFSHAIGAAFRYKIFNVGMEYVFGGINSIAVSSKNEDINIADVKTKANSFRIKLGFKF